MCDQTNESKQENEIMDWIHDTLYNNLHKLPYNDSTVSLREIKLKGRDNFAILEIGKKDRFRITVYKEDDL